MAAREVPWLRRVPLWVRRVPPWAMDAGLAIVVATVTVTAMRVATEPGARPPDAVSYGLGVLVGALLLVRRRFPLGVLIATGASMLVYYLANYAGFSPGLPLAVALYTAAAAGRVGVAALIVLVFVVGEVVARGTQDHEPVWPLIGDAVEQAGLMIAVVLLGAVIRNRRTWLKRAAEDREREAERRVTEERLRIARELHDVLAHTVSAISVQARVADDVLDEDPERAHVALGSIHAASRDAAEELKATLGALRDAGDPAPKSPPTGLAALDGLFTVVRDAGLRVDAAVTGERRPLPAAVEATAYRIVQESLTNVVRHAAATVSTVTVHYERDALLVEIADDGRGAAASAAGNGHGLVGMRERVDMLGGRLHAGARAGGGFAVRARLPADSHRETE